MKDMHRGFEAVFLISQLIIIVLYIVLTEDNGSVDVKTNAQGDVTLVGKDKVAPYYSMYTDVHVMVFIGFAFLYSTLKSHSWTTIGYNFLIACYVIEITILVFNFWHFALLKPFDQWSKIKVDVPALLIGDFSCVAFLTAFGAFVGRTSLTQLWFLATCEVVFWSLN